MTRHELKEQIQHDAFTDSVARVVEYSSEHRQRITQWAIAAVVAAAVIAGGIWYASYHRAQQQKDLEAAFEVLSAQVGAPNQFGKTFPTEDAKKQASLKALSDVVAKDGGSRAGLIAQYYRGTLRASTDPKNAESDLRTVIDSRSEVAPLAKIALAQLYASENRMADAQGLLRTIVEKPSDLVSKAQAEVLLAQLEQTSDPRDAKKLLNTLKKPDQDPVVTRAVDQLSAQLNK